MRVGEGLESFQKYALIIYSEESISSVYSAQRIPIMSAGVRQEWMCEEEGVLPPCSGTLGP